MVKEDGNFTFRRQMLKVIQYGKKMYCNKAQYITRSALSICTQEHKNNCLVLVVDVWYRGSRRNEQMLLNDIRVWIGTITPKTELKHINFPLTVVSEVSMFKAC